MAFVSIGHDAEKEYIEIDFDNLELDKFYLVDYNEEKYAFRKISTDALVSYDVE